MKRTFSKSTGTLVLVFLAAAVIAASSLFQIYTSAARTFEGGLRPAELSAPLGQGQQPAYPYLRAMQDPLTALVQSLRGSAHPAPGGFLSGVTKLGDGPLYVFPGYSYYAIPFLGVPFFGQMGLSYASRAGDAASGPENARLAEARPR